MASSMPSDLSPSGRGESSIAVSQLPQRCAKNLAGFADQRGAVHDSGGVGEGAGYADADGVRSAEQRVGIQARGMALHQHLAPEGVSLHGVAAGIKQERVAAEDLPVAKQDHAAALARTSVQQVDVDRIKPV